MKQIIVEYAVQTVAGIPTASGLPWVRFVTSTFVGDDETLPPLSSIVPEARKHAFLADGAERIVESDLYVERFAIIL